MSKHHSDGREGLINEFPAIRSRVIKYYSDDTNREGLINECSAIRSRVINSLISKPFMTINRLWSDNKLLGSDLYCVSGVPQCSIDRDAYRCIGCDRYNRIIDTDYTGRLVSNEIVKTTQDIYIFSTLRSNRVLVDEFTADILINWLLERYTPHYTPLIRIAYYCTSGGTKIIDNKHIASTIAEDQVLEVFKQVVMLCCTFQDLRLSIGGSKVEVIQGAGDVLTVVVSDFSSSSIDIPTTGVRLVSQTPRDRITPPPDKVQSTSTTYTIQSRQHLDRLNAAGVWVDGSLNCYLMIKSILDSYPSIVEYPTTNRIIGGGVNLYNTPLSKNFIKTLRDVLF